MNKKLLTLAIGAAIATAPFVTAQAAPTVYGKAHVSVNSLNDDSGNSNDSNIGVSSNRSRLGVKGTETLGNGLSAFYKFEWEMDLSGDGRNFEQRNTYTGLKGSFGSVAIGKMDTPEKLVGNKADLFYRSQVGENRNVTNKGGWDARTNNTILYTSPKVNGVQAMFAYVTDTNAGGTDDNDYDAISLNATYSNGPIFLGLGYGKMNQNSTVAAAANQESDSTLIRLVGAYVMNAWKFTALWQMVGNESFGSTAVAGDEDRDVWGLGTSYKMGNNTFKIQYYVAGDLDSTTTGDDGADIITIGVDHKLSPKTMVYAAYATTDNDAGANYDVVGGGHGDARNNSVAGTDPSVFSVGMIYNF